jgi:hypothetical protein
VPTAVLDGAGEVGAQVLGHELVLLEVLLEREVLQHCEDQLLVLPLGLLLHLNVRTRQPLWEAGGQLKALVKQILQMRHLAVVLGVDVGPGAVQQLHHVQVAVSHREKLPFLFLDSSNSTKR